MSDGVLSQEEINALLGMSNDDESSAFDENETTDNTGLSEEEKDAIGEIGNISMGTSATTLFTLLNQKVSITTPHVKVWTWDDFTKNYPDDIVAINVDYKEGLTGSNLLLLKEEDVKKITDIMMGGDGTNTTGELTEIHLSAIAEAMNQMVGSSSTSMSQMLNRKVDISPPEAFLTKLDKQSINADTGFDNDPFVQVAFSMKIGDIIDSEIMQILPISFAKKMVELLINNQETKVQEDVPPITPFRENKPQPKPEPTIAPSNHATPPPKRYEQERPIARDIDIQKPQFPQFDEGFFLQQKENMDIIMDVPLEVTVELGRTSKKIKDILEFNPGTIIELDRLAGEPIDILVNGKFVAQGEVVVIDENFGIRITEIINPELRV